MKWKKSCWIIILLITGYMVVPVQRAEGQVVIAEVIKAGVKRIIKAIDLKIQRIQNKTIWLQNAQKTLENAMSKLKLDEIAGWVNKQKKLYRDYYKELWKVKMLLSYYSEVKDITQKQVRIIKEYQRAWKLLRGSKHFTTEELDYMGGVYSGILEETAKNVDLLLLVANSFTTQMSDAERLKLIHDADSRVDQNYTDLILFNRQNRVISLQRAKLEHSLNTFRQLFSTNK